MISSQSDNESPIDPRSSIISIWQPTTFFEFNPLQTGSGQTSRFRLNILLDSAVYIAGGYLNGRLELICNSKRNLFFGEIAVELSGVQEILDKHRASSQPFLSSRIRFQGHHVPPSNAVTGPQIEDGFWQAKKGKTIFPFSFRIPEDAPSSFRFAQMADLRYLVTGVVQYRVGKSDYETLFRSKEAFLVESFFAHQQTASCPSVRVVMENTGLETNSDGNIAMEAVLQKRVCVAGEDAFVQVHIKNDTKCKVQLRQISVVRSLKFIGETDETKVLKETLSSVMLRGNEYLFEPGEGRSNILAVNIPASARTISHASLFKVDIDIVVKVCEKGSLSIFDEKIAEIQVPVLVYHSASFQSPTFSPANYAVHPSHYNNLNELDGNEIEAERGIDTKPSRTDLSPPGRILPWKDDQDPTAAFESISPIIPFPEPEPISPTMDTTILPENNNIIPYFDSSIIQQQQYQHPYTVSPMFVLPSPIIHPAYQSSPEHTATVTIPFQPDLDYETWSEMPSMIVASSPTFIPKTLDDSIPPPLPERPSQRMMFRTNRPLPTRPSQTEEILKQELYKMPSSTSFLHPPPLIKRISQSLLDRVTAMHLSSTKIASHFRTTTPKDSASVTSSMIFSDDASPSIMDITSRGLDAVIPYEEYQKMKRMGNTLPIDPADEMRREKNPLLKLPPRRDSLAYLQN